MGVIEETRQLIQDFLAPELREIRTRLDKLEENSRMRFEKMEALSLARFEILVQRLDTIQQSFAFDKRISDLEADKRRSA